MKPKVLAIVYYINWLVFKVFKKLSVLKWISRMVISIKLLKRLKKTIKQYSKVHRFIRLIRPRWIKKNVFVGNRFLTNKKNCIRQESPWWIKKIVFVGNRSRRIKRFYSPGISPTNKKILFVENRPRRIKKIVLVENCPRRIKNCLFVGIPDE